MGLFDKDFGEAYKVFKKVDGESMKKLAEAEFRYEGFEETDKKEITRAIGQRAAGYHQLKGGLEHQEGLYGGPEPVIVSNPFDLEPVKVQFNAYLEAVNSMLEQAMEYRITDQASMERAVAMLGTAVKLGKKLEVNRKSIVEKPNIYVKFVNSFAKKFYDTNPKTRSGLINKIEIILKRKIAEHTLKQELERREKEKKALEAAAALQAAIDTEAKEKGIETVKMAPVAVAEVAKVTRSDSGASVSMAKTWKAEVVDAEAVERRFCSPDSKKYNEAVKAGLREAKGLRIYQDTQVKLRA